MNRIIKKAFAHPLAERASRLSVAEAARVWREWATTMACDHQLVFVLIGVTVPKYGPGGTVAQFRYHEDGDDGGEVIRTLGVRSISQDGAVEVVPLDEGEDGFAVVRGPGVWEPVPAREYEELPGYANVNGWFRNKDEAVAHATHLNG